MFSFSYYNEQSPTGTSRPRWICQHLLSRLKYVRGDPAGYTRFAVTDHGIVVASGRCDTDGIPNGRSLGSWNWYHQQQGNVATYPRDVASAIRLRTSPPMMFFGNPIDLEQMRIDVNALNFDPSSRTSSRNNTFEEEQKEDDSSDEEEVLTSATELEDEWTNKMWFVHRELLRTTLTRLKVTKDDDVNLRGRLRKRLKSLTSSLRSRHHDLIVQLRREEMKLLNLRHKTCKRMRLEIEALEKLFDEVDKVDDDDQVGLGVVEPLLAVDVFCGPIITFVRTNDNGLYVFGRPSDVFTANEIREGLNLSSMIESSSTSSKDQDEHAFSDLQVTVDQDDEFVGLTIPHRVQFNFNNLVVEKVACGGCAEGGQDAFTMFLVSSGEVYVVVLCSFSFSFSFSFSLSLSHTHTHTLTLIRTNTDTHSDVTTKVHWDLEQTEKKSQHPQKYQV